MIITIPVMFVEFDDDTAVVETENGTWMHVGHETSVSLEPVSDVHGNVEYKREAQTVLGWIFVEIYEGEFARIDDRLSEEFKRQLTAQIESEAERLAKEAEEV